MERRIEYLLAHTPPLTFEEWERFGLADIRRKHDASKFGQRQKTMFLCSNHPCANPTHGGRR